MSVYEGQTGKVYTTKNTISAFQYLKTENVTPMQKLITDLRKDLNEIKILLGTKPGENDGANING